MGLVKRSAKASPEQGAEAAQERPLSAADLERLLRSPEAAERRRGAQKAAQTPGGAALLVAAVGPERDASVLESLSFALSEVMDDGVADALLEHLRSDNAAGRNMVIDLLAERPELLLDRLPRLMRDREVDFRILLVQVAIGMRSKEALDRLCEALPEETDDNVCASILEALAENGEGATALAAAEAAAERFADHPFLSFVADLARERLTATARRR